MNEKLVRDRIPEIIEKEMDHSPLFRIANNSEMPDLMLKKLCEELAELGFALEEGTIEDIINELTDVAQVLKDGGIPIPPSSSTIEAKRKEKEFTRGGFKKRIVMNFRS